MPNASFVRGRVMMLQLGVEAVVNVREVTQSVYEKVRVIGDGAKR